MVGGRACCRCFKLRFFILSQKNWVHSSRESGLGVRASRISAQQCEWSSPKLKAHAAQGLSGSPKWSGGKGASSIVNCIAKEATRNMLHACMYVYVRTYPRLDFYTHVHNEYRVGIGISRGSLAPHWHRGTYHVSRRADSKLNAYRSLPYAGRTGRLTLQTVQYRLAALACVDLHTNKACAHARAAKKGNNTTNPTRMHD